MRLCRRLAVWGPALAALTTAEASAFAERDREAVLEAVLLYQAWQFADAHGAEMPICLGVTEGDETVDPSRSLLQRVREKADVRPVSECRTARAGVTTADGTPAMVLGVGPIKWLADDEARVRGRYFRTAASSASPVYRVVLEKGRWLCLGPVVVGLPL